MALDQHRGVGLGAAIQKQAKKSTIQISATHVPEVQSQ